MDKERKKTEKTEGEFLSAYDAYADEIFRYLYFRLPDREIAKDLAQETFLRAWKSIAEGADFYNMRAFLYRVARNLAVDFYRKKKEERLDDMREGGFEPSADAPQKDFLEAEAVRKLLLSLEEKQRDAVTLRFLNELSVGEIARITGATETLVSVRIHRGLKKLRLLRGEQRNKQL